MHEIAGAALGPGVVARAVELKGFGSRRLGEAAVFGAGGVTAGGLLGGAADAVLVRAAEPLRGTGGTRLIDVPIGEDPAVEAGLACGGVARVLLSDLAGIPPAWWEALAARVPAALVTPLDGSAARVITLPDADDSPTGALLRRGAPGVQVGDDAVIEVWWPQTQLLVVGVAELAGALARQAALLGWASTLDDAASADAAAAAAGRLGPADAIVVLTHDPAVAIPALQAALTGSCGFVGALGSRNTQANRRSRLLAAGLAESVVDQIHGPVGLDLGARSPEETALAICAEIIATRSGRTPGSLRESTGPING